MTFGLKNSKQIAITIDDGPTEHTNKFLDILKNYQVKASFFLLGKNIEENQDIVKRMISEGHVIGNHTFTHKFFNQKTSESSD